MNLMQPATNDRTEDVKLSKALPFAKMILDQEVRQGLQKANYIYPTTLQATTISLGRSGKDLLIWSKSGTGKTLIFACVILEKYRNDIRPGPQSLVIVPTRELAIQIADVLNSLGHYKKDFFAVVVIGGLSIIDDRNRLQNAKCVVGTPGRLLHLIKNGILNTNNMTLLIVDEADKLYREMDHNASMKLIIKSLPKERQTIVCSATFENNFDQQLAKLMHKPLLVSNENCSTVLIGIKQFVIELSEEKNSYLEIQTKLNAIKHIFKMVIFKQCIIFAGSQLRADSYHTYLMKLGWKCDVISGKQDQNTRIIKFRRFREKETNILVTTDLMARGIDSDDVNLVINLDLPYDITTYLHRIGRAGRFGTHGIAVSCVCSQSDYQFFSTLKMAKCAHESILLKFPSENDTITRNIWDFSNIEEDIVYYGVLDTDKLTNSLSTTPAANEANGTASTIKCTGNDRTINIGYNNHCNDVNTNTFVVQSNANLNNLSLENELEIPPPQPTSAGSQYSPTQYLATSDTIDDASSIAADSLDSYQQLCRRHSIIRQKSAIPKLLNELHIDDVSSNDTANTNLKMLKSCTEEKSILVTDIFDQLRSLVIDKPNNTSNNECLDPFQNYGIYCSDNNDLTSVSQNDVMPNKQQQDSESMDINNRILIYDELDSDESVKTVATKSNKYKLKSSISMDSEIKHFLSPNCEHQIDSNKSENKAINQDFIQDLSSILMKHISNYGLSTNVTPATATTTTLSHHVNTNSHNLNMILNSFYNNNINDISSLQQKLQRHNNKQLVNKNLNNVESNDMNENEDHNVIGDKKQYPSDSESNNSSTTDDKEYSGNNKNYNKCHDANKIDKKYLENENNVSNSGNNESNDELQDESDFDGTSDIDSCDNDYNYTNNVHCPEQSSSVKRCDYKEIYFNQIQFIENYSSFYTRMWKRNCVIDRKKQ